MTWLFSTCLREVPGGQDEAGQEAQEGSPPSRSKRRDLRRRGRTRRAPDPPDQKVLAVVSYFVYLGNKFCPHLGAGEEVSVRIAAAAKANARLVTRVWRCSVLCIGLKMELYTSFVVSVFLYGLSGRLLTKGGSDALKHGMFAPFDASPRHLFASTDEPILNSSRN